MSILHFAQFNNYASKELKGVGNSLNDYNIQFSTSVVNFNIRDGVKTEHTINDKNKVLDGVNFPFNYCIVTDDFSSEITSRWFVMDAVFSCKYQWNVTLLRDTLVDYFDTFQNTPFYCEKGMVSGANDPLVYNAEPRRFNQILKSRQLLTQSENQNKRYIIGYVDKTWPGGKIWYGSYAGTFTEESSPFYDFITGKKKLFKYSTTTPYCIEVPVQTSTGSPPTAVSAYAYPGSAIDPSTFSPISSIPILSNGLTIVDYLGILAGTQFQNTVTSIIGGYTGAQDSFVDYSSIAGYNGKKVLIDNTPYLVNISVRPTYGKYMVETPPSAASRIAQAYVAADPNAVFQGGDVEPWYSIYAYGQLVDISLTNVSSTESFVDLSGTRSGDQSLPYNIFCMDDTAANREFAGFFASQYAGANVLYDLQLFPFEPSYDDSSYVSIPNGGAGRLHWASSASRSGTLYHGDIAVYNSISDKKTGSVQDMCRMISPNGSSVWEFNPSQIGGVPENSIRYEFTLMPFSPYLHIFPTFGGIYGNVNKSSEMIGETRGIICKGPWSLPYSTDKWATYQLQNSAYRDSFDRSIENMSISQSAQRISELIQIGGGVIQGTATGAMAGGIGGAVAGGVGSLLTGVLGGALNESMRREQMDYTVDQFHNSLRNIQAQAQPLASTSSITIGNSWFPIIEFYSATDEEKTLLNEQLRLEGYTIGKFTTFANCKNNANSTSRYVRGRLTNFNMEDDNHIAQQIVSELSSGIYVEI